MLDKNPYSSPSSDGTASVGWSDKYLQAVFCTEPSKNPALEELVHTNPVVIRYTGDNLRYIVNHTIRLIRLAIENQWAAYEDFVLVVQRGAEIRYPLLDLLYEKGLKIKYCSGLGGSLIMSTKSAMHGTAAMIPQSLRDKLVRKGDLFCLVTLRGSGEIDLVLHSMAHICAELYCGHERALDQAKRLLTAKERDGPCARKPDFSAFPTYMSYVRRIQGLDWIPTFLMETAISNTAMKMKVDSVGTLLGTKFQVDILLGIELHVDKAREELKTLDLVIFDATIWSLLAILGIELWNGDRRRHAMVSFVLERKVHQKLCDIKALLRILSWDGDNKTFNTIIKSIKEDFKRCEPLRTLRSFKLPVRATKKQIEECFRLYRNVSTEKLLEEQKNYQVVASICSSVRRTYKGNMKNEKFQKDAECFVAKYLYYGRRIVKDIDWKSNKGVEIPSIVLTGVPMSNDYYTTLSPESLNSLFGTVAMEFRVSKNEEWEALLTVPRNAIRPGSAKEVAEMNGCKSLKKLYERSSETPKIRTKLTHLTDRFIRDLLMEWGVSPKGARHILLYKFIEQYKMKCPGDYRSDSEPSTDHDYPSDHEPSTDHLGRKRRMRSPSSESPEPQKGAPKTNESSTRRKKKRSLESLTSDSGDQKRTGQVESQSDVGRAVESSSGTASNSERLASEQQIPRSISDLLHKNLPEQEAERIRVLLLEEALQSPLQAIVQDEVALRGLELQLQDNVIVLEAILSKPIIVHEYLHKIGAQ